MTTPDEISLHLDHAKDQMNHAIEHLNKELTKVRAGKVSANMLDGLMVSYYGSPTPINQVANISAADSRTLVIQPWEKNTLGAIEKSIFEANLGITPQNDGSVIRVMIPPLTEERRKEMVKKAKHEGEEAKISIRNARRDFLEFIKKTVKNGYPEDEGKGKEALIQDITNKYSEKVEHAIVSKEKEIMTV